MRELKSSAKKWTRYFFKSIFPFIKSLVLLFIIHSFIDLLLDWLLYWFYILLYYFFVYLFIHHLYYLSTLWTVSIRTCFKYFSWFLETTVWSYALHCYYYNLHYIFVLTEIYYTSLWSIKTSWPTNVSDKNQYRHKKAGTDHDMSGILVLFLVSYTATVWSQWCICLRRIFSIYLRIQFKAS